MGEKDIVRDLDVRAGLFNALGHPVRLLIINLVRGGPRHGKELAAILHIHPSTVSHHLAALVEAGLLQSQRDGYYRNYSLRAEVFNQTLANLVRLPQPVLREEAELGAYRRKVLDAYCSGGRLVRIPLQQKARWIVLRHIAQAFQHGLSYPEREVNAILLNFHRDVGSLRRELVKAGLLGRQRGFYWRAESE